VVHATGFSAKAVGKFIKKLLEAYGSYSSISGESFETMFVRVKKVCNNEQKAFAVYKTAKILKEASENWKKWKQENASHPDLLKKLPYIGKVTCFHLARNIGLLEFVKPDLHLVRMANHWGFKDSVSLCEAVRPVGMPLGVVDLILWFSASTFGTISVKKDGER
jgi:endonuclease III